MSFDQWIAWRKQCRWMRLAEVLKLRRNLPDSDNRIAKLRQEEAELWQELRPDLK